MKNMDVLWMILALVACGCVAPADTVDSLVAHPARLRKVMHDCQVDHAKLGYAACNMASEAFRRRFMGNGNDPYTPQPPTKK